MPDDFNPYRQWLDLDEHISSSPNYYDLLALPIFEKEMQEIAAAADRTMSHVRSFLPGEHARQWSELLDELLEVKSCLTDSQRKLQYDNQLRQQISAAGQQVPSSQIETYDNGMTSRYPPGVKPPGSQETEESDSVFDEEFNSELFAPESLASMPGVIQVDKPEDAPQQETSGGDEDQQPLPVAPESRAEAASENELDTKSSASLRDAPGISYKQVWFGKDPGKPPEEEDKPVVSLPSDIPAKDFRNKRMFVGFIGDSANLQKYAGLIVGCGALAIALLLAVMFSAKNSPQENQPNDSTTNLPRTNQEGRTSPTPPAPLNQPSDSSPRTQPEPAAPPQPSAASSTSTTPRPKEPAGTTSPVVSPEPAGRPASRSTPSAPPVGKPANQDLFKLLQDARLALTQRNLEQADAALAKAESLANDPEYKKPEHKKVVARLKLLSGYVRKFWEAVSQGLESLEDGAQLKVGSKDVSVVEASFDKLVIQIDDVKQSYSISEIPGGLAITIAQRVLDPKSSQSKLIQGAIYAVDEDPSTHVNALRLWVEAGAAGADVSEIIRVLQDDYDFEKK